MAVIFFEEKFDGCPCKGTASGNTYSARYIVKTNSAADNSKTVIDYILSTGGHAWGETLSYGNDTDTDSFLRAIEPQRERASPLNWDVTLTYEPVTTGGGEEQNPDKETGEPTTNPLLWEDTIDEDSISETMPVERAIFYGSFLAGGQAEKMRPKGTLGPVINSAGLPFVPGLEREENIKVVRRGFYTADASLASALAELENTINRNDYEVDRADLGYTRTWLAQRALFKRATASYRRVNNIPCWHNQIEIWVRRQSWRVTLYDKGRFRRALPDDKNEYNIRYQNANGTFVDVAPIVDRQGDKITEDCYLDGDGQPLKYSHAPALLEYGKYPERGFIAAIMHPE